MPSNYFGSMEPTQEAAQKDWDCKDPGLEDERKRKDGFTRARQAGVSCSPVA